MELERAQLTGDPVALAMFDIDHFKHYNDTHGHQEGNRVLQKVADRPAAAATWWRATGARSSWRSSTVPPPPTAGASRRPSAPRWRRRASRGIEPAPRSHQRELRGCDVPARRAGRHRLDQGGRRAPLSREGSRAELHGRPGGRGDVRRAVAGAAGAAVAVVAAIGSPLAVAGGRPQSRDRSRSVDRRPFPRRRVRATPVRPAPEDGQVFVGGTERLEAGRLEKGEAQALKKRAEALRKLPGLGPGWSSAATPPSRRGCASSTTSRSRWS